MTIKYGIKIPVNFSPCKLVASVFKVGALEVKLTSSLQTPRVFGGSAWHRKLWREYFIFKATHFP